MPSYDENSVLTLAGLKTALTRAKAETLAAIAAAGHLSKKKVDAVPEAANAEENTFYFVKNNDTGHYDIYFKIDGVMELIDDTTVDMEGYVTDEALSEALNGVGGGALYKGTKTDLSTADSAVIEAYFTEHGDVTPKPGDAFIVATVVSGVTYEQSAYQYNGTG